jgi:lipid-A-disaccharide synthase
MLTLVDEFPTYHFVIAGAPNMDESLYKELIGNRKVSVVFGQTYPLLQQSEAAVVTSGTATLETALFGIPQVVCYIGNALSYQIAKRLVNVKYISLPNLILDRDVLTELIQNDCNPLRLKQELSLIIKGGDNREKMELAYQDIHGMLGLGGASQKVAQYLLKTI